ncbi:hypothetical protein [Actinocrispum sp. NPDC049592]|uniref:hypothetical protein n=1 Tax=Actinocrispum sp. NPDC049592 TaxID=3154835 RepID=UPI0034387554
MIDDFLDAVGVAFANAGQIVPWPMHVAQIGPFFGDLEAADLMRRYTSARENGVCDGELAKLYPSTSSAKSLMLDLVPGMKVAGIPAAGRVTFVTGILSGLAEIETGDVFCRDGGHRLLGADEVQRLAGGPGWVTGSARAAFELSGAAQALVWSMHFYGWTDISFVIHGPYQAGDQVLIVRDFFDLRPGELWPQLPAPPCRELRVLSLHDTTDTFRIDIFNHLLHERPLRESTRAVRVIVDGHDVAGGERPLSLRKDLVGLVRRQKTAIDGLSEREVLTKFVESRYYALRGWRTRDGDAWRPPPEVYERIAQEPIPPAPADDNDEWPVLRDIFDPRAELPAN